MNTFRTKLSLLALTIAILFTSACTKVDIQRGISDTAIKTNPVSQTWDKLMCLPGSQICQAQNP